MDIRKNKKSYVKEAKRRTRKKNNKSTIFVRKPKGRFVSFWCQMIGFLLASIGGITFLIQWIDAMSRGMGPGVEICLMLFLFIVGMVLFYRGYETRKFHGRFRFYRRLLEDRESVSLEELSDMTGHKVKFLQKDLKKMIEQKMLLQGRLDRQEKYLFLTLEAYEDYVNGAESSIYEEANRYEEANSVKDSKEKKFKKEGSENESKQNDTDSYLAFYGLMQKRIKGKSIQRIITDFGVYTVRILAYDIETEGKDRFLAYYFPLTKELLLSYEEMEKEGISETATDLEDILNTIRYSFETFAGRLAEGKGMDVETDILALETMLNR